MTKKEKAQQIIRLLDKFCPNTSIPLNHKDPFTLLVAVVLSGQSTDKSVNKVTPALFKLASTPEKMAELPVTKIREIIKPCGLSPAKSKNIKALSRILVKKYHFEVPQTFVELESLPGVGHKTASVVMSQAFGKPAFPVDTHIHRLAYRWGLSNGKNVTQTEKDLKRLFPQELWNKLHLQMIYFGREYCPARGHDPKKCPVCSRFGRKSLFR
ncbi:endonuclease III [Candidatus Peregrinibacteria bacterium]|nr:endonuclease III [Candidatus Peregrinibacteria bacterium]